MSIPKYRYLLIITDVVLTALASYLVFSFAFQYYFVNDFYISIAEQWEKILYLFLFTLGPVLIFSIATQFPLFRKNANKKTDSGSKGFLAFFGYFGIQLILSLIIELGPGYGHNIINDIWYNDQGDFLVFCLVFECVKLVLFALNRLFYFFLEPKPSQPQDVNDIIIESWEDVELIEIESTTRKIQKNHNYNRYETSNLKRLTQKEKEEEHIMK